MLAFFLKSFLVEQSPLFCFLSVLAILAEEVLQIEPFSEI